MAVTRVTSYAAGAVISNAAARVSAVHVILPTDGTSGNTFVMLYDKATAPTGGTDTPDVVYKVAIPSQEGNVGMRKLIFPGGGDRFGTGVGLFVATTFNGATGVTTTAPYAVDVFFETGG
jgi:hypothetical protein